METVKDLMVGEKTQPALIIYESFMQCLVNGLKLYIRALGIIGTAFAVSTHLAEDITQTLLLFPAVGKNIPFIIRIDILQQGILEQIEILMKQRLRSDGKSQRGISLQ